MTTGQCFVKVCLFHPIRDAMSGADVICGTLERNGDRFVYNPAGCSFTTVWSGQRVGDRAFQGLCVP
jgi:hypothetical protein